MVSEEEYTLKAEKNIAVFCERVQREVILNIVVHLAERWCGYDIVRLSGCQSQDVCGTGQCEIIYAEEENAFDQLIADYHKQQDIRDRIRDKIKYSNQ
jgi:hypothetical protein